MPVDKFLALDDVFEINLWMMIAERVLDMKQKLDKNLAVMIRNEVGKMLSGKR